MSQESLCPYYTFCGGCHLQALTPDEQIAQKQLDVLKLFKTCGVQPAEVLSPIMGPAFGYRRKARLSAKFVIKKDKALVGFREKNGRYVADIDVCKILHPSVGEKIQALKTFIASLSNYKDIPQLEIAAGDDRTALIFRHLSDFSSNDLTKLREFGQVHAFDIYLQPKGLDTVHKIFPASSKSLLSYQLAVKSEKKNKLALFFHPTDFIQVNASINQKIADRVISWLDLGSCDDVLDLFCGLGNFTLPMACFARSVKGLENDALLIERARENAAYNQLQNASFYRANLFENLDSQIQLDRKFDKILLDPPRTGAMEMIKQLPRFSPKRIVYVSCNPASLARDVAVLVHEQNFICRKLVLADMFPHTRHVETIALLEIRT